MSSSSFAITISHITKGMAKFNILLILGSLMGLLWTQKNSMQNGINNSDCTENLVFFYAYSLAFFFYTYLGPLFGDSRGLLRLGVIPSAVASGFGFWLLSLGVAYEVQILKLRTHDDASGQSTFSIGVVYVLPFLAYLPILFLFYLILLVVHVFLAG